MVSAHRTAQGSGVLKPGLRAGIGVVARFEHDPAKGADGLITLVIGQFDIDDGRHRNLLPG